MARHRAKCDCGAFYQGDAHYYKTEYCVRCGRWLYWDKFSDIQPQYTQAEMRIATAGRGRDF